MNSLSKRGQEVFASPFRKMLPFAEEAKRRGVHVHHLNIGNPDIFSPAQAVESLKDWSKPMVPYGKAAGVDELRQAVAEAYVKLNISLDKEDIVITTGASEAIFLSLMAVCDAGDQIIVPEPFYANYRGFCDMANVQVKAVPSSLADGFPIPSASQFAELIEPHTKVFLLANPNNPTGKVYTKADLLALAEVCNEHDIFLIVDEAYRDFIYSDIPFYSALAIPHISQKVIVIDSFSKRFSACGIRVGILCSRNRAFIETIVRYARLRLSPPMLGQHFALHALESGKRYFDAVKQSYKERRDLVIQRLQRVPGVELNVPEGAFYVFAALPIENAESFCKWLLTDFSHNKETVMLSYGSAFYETPNKGINEIRIAYVIDLPELSKAMDCFEIALLEYKGIEAGMMSVSG